MSWRERAAIFKEYLFEIGNIFNRDLQAPIAHDCLQCIQEAVPRAQVHSSWARSQVQAPLSPTKSAAASPH